MKLRLFSPFLLKRLVRALERNAEANERIAEVLSYKFGGPTKVREVLADEDDDFLIATDRDTYFRELDAASRLQRAVEEE